MYIKSKDEDAVHDNWLTGISSKDIAKVTAFIRMVLILKGRRGETAA